jgi:hypothetical protein
MLVFATLNDDPETLEIIVNSKCAPHIKNVNLTRQRTLSRGISVPEEEEAMVEVAGRSLERHRHPLLVACTQGFPACVRILYRAGYNFKMYEDDSRYIEELMEMDHAKASASNYYLYSKMYLGEKNMKSLVKKRRPVSIKPEMDKDDDFDPVERFIRFRAYASPTYISVAFTETDIEKLNKMDPIRKAIACSTYATYLGDYYPQQQTEYTAVGAVCQQYAEDILDQCQNMKEVRILLSYSNCTTNNPENQNWSIALWEKNKALVGHHYYQKFLWDKMTGGDLDWQKYFFCWKIVITFGSILCFIISPFVIIADFFRKADILFVPPEGWRTQKQKFRIQDELGNLASTCLMISSPAHSFTEQFPHGQERETRFFRFFRDKFHRPMFRISTFLVFEVIFLISLSLALVDPNDNAGKDWWWYDTITGIFAVLYLFENCMDVKRMKFKYFSSPWNLSSITTHLLIVLGSVLIIGGFTSMKDDRRNEWSGNHVANVGATLMSLGATLSIIRTLRWLRLIRVVGPIVICTSKVMKDIFLVLILFAITLLAFALGLMSMFKPFRYVSEGIGSNSSNSSYYYIGGKDDNEDHKYRFDSNDNIFSTMFWRLLDPGQPTAAFILRNKTVDEYNETMMKMFNINDTNNLEDYQVKALNETIVVKSLEFSHLMGITLWAAYQFFVVIVFVNILIALMNTTYSKLTLEADTEWKYHTAVVYDSFLTPQSVLPPPLRIFYYLARLINKLRGGRGEEVCDELADRETYHKLMTKLIRRKTQSDIEKTRDDNFADMRKDVRNTIQNEVVKKLENESQQLMGKIAKLTQTVSKLVEMKTEEQEKANKLEVENKELMKKVTGLTDSVSSIQSSLQLLTDKLLTQ